VVGDVPILGIPAFDGPVGRVLPAGWLAIVEGESGAGMQLLAKQFARSGLGNAPVYYYTTYERTEDIRRTFQDYGWNADGLSIANLSEEYYARVLDRDLEVWRARERGLRFAELAGPVKPAEPSVIVRPTARVLADLSSLDTRFRLVLDSLDFLFEVVSEEELLAVVRQIRRRSQALGGEAMLVIQAGVHDRRTIGLLEDLADLLLELRAVERDGAFRPLLTIRKVRNHPELTRRVPLEPTATGLSTAAGA
jgi:KaiC/GvpD/RAD55 family RecA-like ATPase